ncbi:MAG: ATP-binding protein [Pseudomonadota bacterium]
MSAPQAIGKMIVPDFQGDFFFDEDPGARPCVDCGQPVPSRHGPGAKWFNPGLCLSCRDAREVERERQELQERAHRAAMARLHRCDIPKILAGSRLGRQLAQKIGETIHDLSVRCAGEAVGVTPRNGAVVEALERYVPSDHSLYIMGTVGSGKSYLAAALAAELALSGLSVWFRSEAELLADERRRVQGGREEDPFLRASEVEVLVLDDFGSSDRMTDWALDMIEGLICSRYNAMRPIVFTSNLPFQEVARHYGERVYSRLCQMVTPTGVLELAGQDWRKETTAVARDIAAGATP